MPACRKKTGASFPGQRVRIHAARRGFHARAEHYERPRTTVVGTFALEYSGGAASFRREVLRTPYCEEAEVTYP